MLRCLYLKVPLYMNLKISSLHVLRDHTVTDYDKGNKVKIRHLTTLETKLAHLDHLKRTERPASSVVEPEPDNEST